MKHKDKSPLSVPEENKHMLKRERDIGKFVSNLSRGSGKAKATRSINISLTGNRRY